MRLIETSQAVAVGLVHSLVDGFPRRRAGHVHRLRRSLDCSPVRAAETAVITVPVGLGLRGKRPDANHCHRRRRSRHRPRPRPQPSCLDPEAGAGTLGPVILLVTSFYVSPPLLRREWLLWSPASNVGGMGGLLHVSGSAGKASVNQPMPQA